MKEDKDKEITEFDALADDSMLMDMSALLGDDDFNNFIDDTTNMLGEMQFLEDKLLEETDFDNIEEIEETTEHEANL